MKSFAPALLTLCLAVFGSASAGANQALAQKKVCLSCHGVDKRSGFPAPSFKEVSARYAGQKDVANKLVPKILNGGTGAWGVMTMPANPQVTEAEARELATWILGLTSSPP